MFEQLVHRTKRTISSDQRIVDPRNVATQHNVASSRGRVVCRNESGKKRKGKSEKEEKKISMALDKLRDKQSCKIRSKTPPGNSLLLSFDPNGTGRTRCIPPLRSFYFFILPPPPENGEKSVSSNSNPAEGGKLRNENSIL